MPTTLSRWNDSGTWKILCKLVDGVWKMVRDCCCVVAGCDCAGGHRASYTIQFSNVSACANCRLTNTGSAQTESGNWTGSYALDYVGGASCLYSKDFDAPRLVTWYSKTDCTGTSYTSPRIRITLHLVSTARYLTAYVFNEELGFDNSKCPFFFGGFTDDYCEVGSVTNTYDYTNHCAPAGLTMIGYGGTASVT